MFPKDHTWRASQVFQLSHSDIYGPITPTSNSNKRYYITFIDDYNRKSWLYLLNEKSKALIAFKKFKADVEKENDLFIKTLRTDRGGEFNSQKFLKFWEMNGIIRKLTTPYSPQQNGVDERKNRTLMNMIRSMLTSKKVPKCFWAEAVN